MGRQLLVAACAALAGGAARADHPLGGLGLGTAGPITTISADTLPRGRAAAALQLEYLAFRPIPDARLRDLAAQDVETHSLRGTFSPSLRLAYGVTDDLTVGLKLPYVVRRDIREAHVETPGDPPELHALGDARGLGDLSVLGQWRFDGRGELRAAALFGVKAPTGRTDRTGATGEAFETEHQPGSGSWDGLLGAAASHRRGRASLDASALFTLAGAGSRDTRLGDRLSLNAALSYRLGGGHAHAEAGEPAPAHTHLAWDVVLELNGEWQARTEVAGARQENTGGGVVYLSPGVRLSGEGWSVFASFGVPVMRDLNGVQHEPDYRLVAGVAAGF